MVKAEVVKPKMVNHGIPAARELPHKPADTPCWSENYVFCGYDAGREVGFYHHLGRMPYDPGIWRGAFTVCLPAGEVVTFKDHGRTGAERGPASPALAFVCEEPLRRWTIRYDGVGRRTTSEALTRGFLADGATVPVTMEVAFEALTPPWAFGDGLDVEVWADLHYEQAGRIEGRLTVDDQASDILGTGYRDHSVGPRDVEPMLSHTWVHGEFPSGRAFQAFVADSRPDTHFGSAYVAAPGDGGLAGARIVEAPGWSGTDGDPGRFTVRLDTDAGPAEIHGRTLPQRYHWTVLSPWEYVLGTDLSAPDLWPCLETMVVYDWDGETGYGLLEVTRPRPG